MPLSVMGQTTVLFDNIETFNWPCYWAMSSPTSGYYMNVSVSADYSAAIYGAGNGSSSVESNIYVLPNVTGLTASFEYALRFRLGSYRFSGPTAATAGVDGTDYLELSVSTNGGTTYTNEIRVAGFSNAYWNYNAAGSIIKVQNGTLSTYAPAAGGNRTTTGDGYSTITLVFTPGITQLAGRIFVRANSTGEEWWIDNIELIETADPALPVELIEYSGINKDGVNVLLWSTASEHNSDYFSIETSTDGNYWRHVEDVKSVGFSTEISRYCFNHYGFEQGELNYYRLKQCDFDGVMTMIGVVVINNVRIETKKVIKIVDMLGREVQGELEEGVYIKIFEDGTMKKIVK